MLVAAFTSAYLVRRAEGNWTEFEIPSIFYYSTGVLVLSSVFMHLGFKSAEKDNFGNLKIFISLTFVSGILFLIMQYIGWTELQSLGIYFKGNPAESFYYVLTGVHAFHLITGLFVLFFSFMEAFKMNIHSKNLIRIEVCATYWHF